jgi:adenylate kinase family enzyme
MAPMKRIVVLGRGASGKSVFARALSDATGIPCIELDKVFWSSDLEPRSLDDWRDGQTDLVVGDAWILDGDLGPYDAPEIRLARADTVVVFDVNLATCAWRALRRSRERLDFWWWFVTWRRRYRPALMHAIAVNAPAADLFIIRNDRDRERILSAMIRRADSSQ